MDDDLDGALVETQAAYRMAVKEAVFACLPALLAVTGAVALRRRRQAIRAHLAARQPIEAASQEVPPDPDPETSDYAEAGDDEWVMPDEDG
jgi:hypothetical protein